MNPLSMMAMMFSVSQLCYEAALDIQAMEESGNSMDDDDYDESYYGEGGGTSAILAGLMAQTALAIGSTVAGVDPAGPATQSMSEAIEEVYEDPDAAIMAAEVGCLSNSDCPPEWVCVFSPRTEKGTCVKRGDIAVQIAGVIDERTCDYCRSQIGRVGSLASMDLPPYHKHCRCTVEYLV